MRALPKEAPAKANTKLKSRILRAPRVTNDNIDTVTVLRTEFVRFWILSKSMTPSLTPTNAKGNLREETELV